LYSQLKRLFLSDDIRVSCSKPIAAVKAFQSFLPFYIASKDGRAFKRNFVLRGFAENEVEK
jgi:hypothetical protein